MKKKTKNKIFSQKNIIFLFIAGTLLFSCSLYYKQYLPKYLTHSIVILLIMIFCLLPFLFKRFKKQRNLIKIIVSALSFSLIVTGILVFNHNDRLAKDGQYIGIDISKWNNNVNLQLARQEIDFVIIRCGYTSLTDGTKTKVDPLFEQNIKQCQNLNIPYGVYYYSLATEAAQAKKEAEYVNHLLDGRVPELGVFIDLEDETFQGALTNDQLTIVATTFLDNIQNQNKKGIYANHHWWTTKLTDKKLDSYIKRKARYNDTPVLEEEYHILQYSETGQIRGINGNVDLNMTINKYW